MASFLRLARSRLARSRLPTTPVTTITPVTRQCLRRQAVASYFHSSALRPALKETDKNRDNLSEEMEQEKNAQLRKHDEGNPHWHESLASASESAVKADRDETPNSEQATAMEEEIRKVKTKKSSSERKEI